MNRVRYLGLSLLLLSALSCLAQDCDSTISDGAHVLGSGYADVEKASQLLINQGSDVRVRTFSTLQGQTLDSVQANLVRSCASWQGANGVTKNNLITILLAPGDRKMGIFYGSLYHSALDNHHARILHDYGAPKFRDKDWAGGVISVETQLATRVAASRDEALHPAVNTTTINEQATDLSGLWTFFKWLLFFFIGGGICWAVIWSLKNKKETEERLSSFRSSAAEAKTQAAIKLSSLRDRLTEAAALQDPNAKRAQVYYDSASQDFGRLNDSASYDPDVHGENEGYYTKIQLAYNRVARTLQMAEQTLSGQTAATPNPAPKTPPTSGHTHTHAYTTGQPETKEPTTRVVEVNHYYDTPAAPIFVPPVVIVEPTPSRRRDEDDEDRSSSASSSSWGSSRSDDGGSSSSWGSSDSGSGSSSDFGGSDGGGGGSDSF